MGIIGLTDRPASFPQIGILRKGAPKPERGPGRDLKYFRFDADDADAAGRFRTVYGDEPTSVRVFLPFAAAVENFEAWQEHWTAGALQHRCDGKTCVLWLNGQRYSQQSRPCPHAQLDAHERDRCKPTGRLKVVIPELRRLAYVTVLTGSIHDIIALTEQLQALEALRGDLRGIPMVLRRVPRDISMPGANGKRTRVEKWLLSIEAAPTWVDLQLQAQQQQALPMAPAPILPAPPVNVLSGEIEDDDDPEGVGDHREQVQLIRDLWRQLADAGQPVPAKHLTLDLDALDATQLTKLEDQARGWLTKHAAQADLADAAPAAA